MLFREHESCFRHLCFEQIIEVEFNHNARFGKWMDGMSKTRLKGLSQKYFVTKDWSQSKLLFLSSTSKASWEKTEKSLPCYSVMCLYYDTLNQSIYTCHEYMNKLDHSSTYIYFISLLIGCNKVSFNSIIQK